MLVIDASRLKARRTVAGLVKGALPGRTGRTKGGLNPKLHGPYVRAMAGLCLSEGQVSDHIGAQRLCPARPDHANGAWVTRAMTAMNIAPRSGQKDKALRNVAIGRLESSIANGLTVKFSISDHR